MNFVYFVIFIFFLFAIRYFYLYSLSNTLQRKQTLKAVILCIYYIPIFSLCLLLFIAGLICFPLFVSCFFHNQLLFFINVNNLNALSYFFINGIFIALLYNFSKKVLLKKISYKSVLVVMIYFLASLILLKVVKDNLFLLFLFKFSENYFYNEIFVQLFTLVLIVSILFFPYFKKINSSLVLYTRLSIKIISGYFVFVILLAVVGLILKLIAYFISLTISFLS